MIAWGPRHFAAGFTRDVEGLRTDVLLLDHKADYRAILRDRRLVTPDYTFFNQPPAWWEERLGTAPVFSSPAPGWVEVRFTPEIRDVPPPDGLPIVVLDAHAVCAPGGLALAVTWAAARIPQADWSVYVHALAADGALLGQGDQRAPVYGLRPTSGWAAGEVIADSYPIALPEGAAPARVDYGLYVATADGSFRNDFSASAPVDCALEAST
jgi:hypothetical protein